MLIGKLSVTLTGATRIGFAQSSGRPKPGPRSSFIAPVISGGAKVPALVAALSSFGAAEKFAAGELQTGG